MANETIKQTAKTNKVKLWEIADVLGIQDSAFSRKLRKELPKSEAENVLHIIADLAQNRKDVQ